MRCRYPKPPARGGPHRGSLHVVINPSTGGADMATTELQVPRDTGVDDIGLEEYFGPMEHYGAPRGPVPPEWKIQVGKAILTIASADGELSAREWSKWKLLARIAGQPQSVIDELSRIDFTREKLETYFTPELRPAARGILHEAVKVARADGYAEEERQATRRAASLLGLDEQFVVALETFLDMEDALNQARSRLLAPIGT
jgi:tellurite resistance protein